MIKETLSKKVSPVKLGFLEGCQIHEAIGVIEEEFMMQPPYSPLGSLDQGSSILRAKSAL